jgi:small subunit ribosomal protein S14
MAKTSLVERNQRRKNTAARYRTKHEKIKELLRLLYVYGATPDIVTEVKQLFPGVTKIEDPISMLQELLQRLPRDASPCRSINRCQICGRSHAVYRIFGICRLCIRKFWMNGFIPGLRKTGR